MSFTELQYTCVHCDFSLKLRIFAILEVLHLLKVYYLLSKIHHSFTRMYILKHSNSRVLIIIDLNILLNILFGLNNAYIIILQHSLMITNLFRWGKFWSIINPMEYSYSKLCYKLITLHILSINLCDLAYENLIFVINICIELPLVDFYQSRT